MAAEVMKSNGKLLCSYPGPAVALPASEFHEDHFLEELANFLFHMNRVVQDNAAAHSRKAGTTVVEERDSADPKYITQVLTGIFLGKGSGVLEEVPRFCKKIADDVLWNNAKLPWRRSQIWLVMRVAMQRVLRLSTSTDDLYKSFMVFFHAKILEGSLKREANGFLLFGMSAKTCRRAAKLGESILPFVNERVLDIATRVQDTLQKRWTLEQEIQSRSPQWDPAGLDPWKDTQLQLKNSLPYIRQALNRDRKISRPSEFAPSEPRRLRDIGGFQHFTTATLTQFFTSSPAVALIDFEEAVRTRLAAWTSIKIYESSTTDILADCLQVYHEHASKEYAMQPENFSLMVLTMFDLWVALDRAAVKQCPLMREYPPIVTTSVLESLLLRKAEDLDRIPPIARYLSQRQLEASRTEHVFSYPPSSSSFYVRFYESSPRLQVLKAKIESEATRKRNQKEEELTQLNKRYRDLMSEANRLAHDHPARIGRWGNIWYDMRHCYHCNLQKEASSLQIDIYEWPLPTDSTLAKAVVYELDPDHAFVAWRQSTLFLLHDVFTPSHHYQKPARAHSTLSTYSSLSSFRVSTGGHERITLGSVSAKSWGVTHYNGMSIPNTTSQVCLKNALHWEMYDMEWSAPIGDPFSELDITARTTLTIPSSKRDYSSLQYSLESASDRQNTALTNQSSCPTDLSLHEFLAFTHLRIGERLSWLSLAKALAGRDLTYSREEVHILILQLILQVGSIGSKGDLPNHVDLKNTDFCRSILTCMDDLLSSVADNWREITTVQTVALVATRMLAACTVETQGHILTVLARARATSLQWIQVLMKEFEEFEGDDTAPLCQRILDIALTCRLTYDVDIPVLRTILESDSTSLSIFVFCGLVVHEMTLAGALSSSTLLLPRDRRLSTRALEEVLKCSSAHHHHPLTQAVKLLWASFPGPEQGWSRFSIPSDHWLLCRFQPDPHDLQVQAVYINVVSGELLVGGKPLSLLPNDIRNHEQYGRLFGKVIGTSTPKMIQSSDS